MAICRGWRGFDKGWGFLSRGFLIFSTHLLRDAVEDGILLLCLQGTWTWLSDPRSVQDSAWGFPGLTSPAHSLGLHQMCRTPEDPPLNVFQCPLPPSAQFLMSQLSPPHMVHARMSPATSPCPSLIPGRDEHGASTMGKATTSLQSKAAKNTLHASER